jgi:hypothetical protein
VENEKSKEIEDWMKAVAEHRIPKKKLILDRETKRLVAVEATDPRADRGLSSNSCWMTKKMTFLLPAASHIGEIGRNDNPEPWSHLEFQSLCQASYFSVASKLLPRRELC